MNSLEAMGQMQLAAAHGQRQIAQVLARWIGQVVSAWMRGSARRRNDGQPMPW